MKKNSYWHKRKLSFGYALNGLRLFAKEAHSRIHFIITILVVLLGFALNISLIEWAVVLIFCALVIALEAINSALERLTDLISPKHNPIAGQVKDIAAGAVLVAAVFAVITGLLIFVPKIFVLFP